LGNHTREKSTPPPKVAIECSHTKVWPGIATEWNKSRTPMVINAEAVMTLKQSWGYSFFEVKSKADNIRATTAPVASMAEWNGMCTQIIFEYGVIGMMAARIKIIIVGMEYVMILIFFSSKLSSIRYIRSSQRLVKNPFCLAFASPYTGFLHSRERL
jgi:hypothetical protein